MRIFISAGEPSGDLHGANLVEHLRARHPDIECVGFGGDKMTSVGCKLLYPLCDLAVMWFARVFANLHKFAAILSQADRYLRHHRPDAVVLIDCPGFNFWIARRAKFHGIPVFYFVPPQIWAWLNYRVRRMQKHVDHVLCCLPFEKTWYAERGVHAHYVGHPYFDELTEQIVDETFVEKQRKRSRNLVALLPGSRTQEVEANLSTLIRAANQIARAVPNACFSVACFRDAHKRMVDEYLGQHPGLPIETHVGRTPEIIESSKTCIAVSGSVSLELLYRAKPSVIVYRTTRFGMRVAGWLMTTEYICLVNLLAGKVLFPELLSHRCKANEAAEHVIDWLTDSRRYEALLGEICTLRQQVAMPGACEYTAEFILKQLLGEQASLIAA